MFTRSLRIQLCFLFLTASVTAADWTRFRGPNGSGVSSDGPAPPTTWSDSENVKWKAVLPGPGLSSPIVIGDRVVVTCWSGYAVDAQDLGSLDDLKRNVVCLDRQTGDVLWSHEEPALLPEDTFSRMFVQNGYASHTPVTDGERVYVFFGKTGVLAFDLGDGRKLWQESVGENREDKGWGSASSPIVHNGLVIVPAFIEGDALVAFDGKTGKVAWKQEAPGYRSNWSTPILVEANDRTDLVLTVPGEVWGLNPANGKLRWYCEIPGSSGARPSVISAGDIVVAMGSGRGGGSSAAIAVQAGGKGDVKDTHQIWEGRETSSIGTPVIRDGQLYMVNNKVVTSVDMKTGKRIAQTRLTGSGGAAVDGGNDREERPERSDRGQGGGGGGGRGGYGGGMGGQDYSSPVIAGNNLYWASRAGDVYVVQLGDSMKQVAHNSFDSDRGEYSSTPAISNGELFIRSAGSLYCVANKE
ncbi:MAG: PQQ-binding-like beta-propeller repeat protein [Fuerstiella sp.]